MKNVGLFFGSFNPIHIGHHILANYMAEFTEVDEVWFVVSPQNPFKEKSTLLNEHHRLQLVSIAAETNDNFRASNIEFSLPKPSYTVDTLAHLKEKYPDINFYLILGEDNLKGFHKWKNHEVILEQFNLLVYPRPNCTETKFHNHPKVQIVEAPQIDISASFIRKAIKDKKNVSSYLHPDVWNYMDEMNFYR